MRISSVSTFISEIKRVNKNWTKKDGMHFLNNNKYDYPYEHPHPWFRGQRKGQANGWFLRPELFRKMKIYDQNYENYLSQTFRLKSPAFEGTPQHRGDLDLWLTLMQHSRVPTRLLDWTESALVALFFAVYPLVKRDLGRGNKEYVNPIVWMIDPHALNFLSFGTPSLFNPWSMPALDWFNIAFGVSTPKDKNPIAIRPMHINRRMSAQRSCFTIHGENTKGIEQLYPELIEKGFLTEFIINKKNAREIIEELRVLGITYSTIYPDLDGLAEEFKIKYIKDIPPPSPLINVTFVIGSTTYLVNNKKMTMSVEPYNKNNRRYVPIKIVARAIGVQERNIIQNSLNHSVTFIRGDRVVQLSEGKDIMVINGVQVQMDVPTEIVLDEFMVPMLWVAQAFGLSLTWDENNQTITFEINID